MPSTLRPDAARRQSIRGHKTGVGVEDSINNAASAVAPLLAAALNAGVRKAESLLRGAAFMSQLDKKNVHLSALFQKGHRAIGLDDSEKNCARGAFGTRAERLRRNARGGGLWWFHEREA